jgi:hypothetical protein
LAAIHSVALAHRATTYSRRVAINSSIERVRLAGELDGVQYENALLEEEIRIKDARMAKLPPRKRPQYSPQERTVILELKIGAFVGQEKGSIFIGNSIRILARHNNK